MRRRSPVSLHLVRWAFRLGWIADADGWRQCAVHCGTLLETTADAAELLIKAAIERRGVSADRSHDIAELAAEFGA